MSADPNLWNAPVTLEGESVRLEPLTRDHEESLWQVAQDPELWRWSTAWIQTREDFRRYLDRAFEQQRVGSALPFATIERTSGRPVGSTRFENIVPTHRRLEIGWTWIGRPWQRTAVNTEAKYLMMRHAFEALGALRVELKTNVLNRTSRNAILRIGAKEEGILRKHLIGDRGDVRDTVYYSVVDDEWPAVKTALEDRMRATRA